MAANMGAPPQGVPGVPTALSPGMQQTQQSQQTIVAKAFPLSRSSPLSPSVIQVDVDNRPVDRSNGLAPQDMVSMAPSQGGRIFGAVQTTQLTFNEQVGSMVYQRVQTSTVNCTATPVDEFNRQQQVVQRTVRPPPPPPTRPCPQSPTPNHGQYGGSSPQPLHQNGSYGGCSPPPMQQNGCSGNNEPPPLPRDTRSPPPYHAPVASSVQWEGTHTWQQWNSSTYGHGNPTTPVVEEVFSSEEEVDKSGGATNPWKDYQPSNGWIYYKGNDDGCSA